MISPEDLQIVESRKHRRQGEFIIFKALKNYVVFIAQDESAERFTVKGLQSSFEEILGPAIPDLDKTVLLPFADEIVADGLY